MNSLDNYLSAEFMERVSLTSDAKADIAILGIVYIYIYIMNIYMLCASILTGLNRALCCESRVSYTEIGNKKDYISCHM